MEHEATETRRVSRRGLVKGVAGGAAVGAVAVAAGTIGATTSAAHADGAKPKVADSVPPADVEAGQFVVHVRDLKAGTLDIYSGSRHMVVTDHEVAGRLAFYTW